MRAGLRSARRAKPAETLTWPSRTLTLSGMAASVRCGHRRAHLERKGATHPNRRAESEKPYNLLKLRHQQYGILTEIMCATLRVIITRKLRALRS